jgi:UDP-2-acetamido-2,6-beta-L-arabino-hexul-4-ose reductase
VNNKLNILVTGAQGFVGKNLCAALKNIRNGKDKSYGDFPIGEIFEFDLATDPALLDDFCQKADFVFNLAGVNRPKEESEFMTGNFGFAGMLLDTLKKYRNSAPVMISSSTQASLENPYGLSKKAGEDLLFRYSSETGVRVFVYRFPNLFGKWCLPDYNSAVATFCHQVAHGLPVTVSNREHRLQLVYIDDLVTEMVAALKGEAHLDGPYCYVPEVHTATLGEITDLLYRFKESRTTLEIASMGDPFTKKLYATYLSYLPENSFSYPLTMNSDERGSFTELVRTPDRGQFSVNISKPHITKGNHWHHTKNEKFVVVSGKGVIRFRKFGDPESSVIEYFVSGDHIEVVDIPTGYIHHIENLGNTDLVTFMWANEPFNPAKPDTYFEKV